jgi:NAD(P)-dependent dehydrogenase (short-subunit alcohol dehydrogenase family)
MDPILVTGATGRVGRIVVAQLLDAGVPVRALTRRPSAARFPAAVEVVAGDLTVPESLDVGLRGVGTVFLLWTAPPTTVPAVVERLALHAQRVVFLSSPHRTPHPFFQQPNPMAALHADIERLIAAAGGEVAHPPMEIPRLVSPLAFPLLISSYWAFIPASFGAILLVVRTAVEDRVLTEELPGYREYAAKTRWRLAPAVF